MCAAVVCVVFYVLRNETLIDNNKTKIRSGELDPVFLNKKFWAKIQVTMDIEQKHSTRIKIGDFNISPLPMKWYKNWKDMWHFTAKKWQTLKVMKQTTKQMWDVELNSPILPLWSYHWSTSIIHEIFLVHFHSFNSTRVFFKISFECFSKIRMLC